MLASTREELVMKPVRVFIEGLSASAYLGVLRSEQKKRRKIIIDLFFEYEHPNSDKITAAIDYRLIRNIVLVAATSRRFHLVETLATAILEAIKSKPEITRISVRVHKPGALRLARSVSVLVKWSRADSRGLSAS